jgi:hypothetical protein
VLPNCYTCRDRTLLGFSAFFLLIQVRGIIFPTRRPSPPDLDEAIQAPIKLLAPNRHLDGIERVLHDVVGIQLIYLLHHCVHIGLLRLSEEQELDTGLCLETLDAEVGAFEDFNTGRVDREGLEVECGSRRRRRAGGWDWRELRCYGVHSKCRLAKLFSRLGR